MSQNDQARQTVYDYCKLMLGDGMIDVELDPAHYTVALDRALGIPPKLLPVKGGADGITH